MRLAFDPDLDLWSYDAPETPKYRKTGEDAEGNSIWERQPYPGSVAPREGKRSPKWDSHREWYAARHNIPKEQVTEDMLFAEGASAKEALVAAIAEGQGIDWLEWDPKINVEIRRYPGKGYYGRDLVAIKNPQTGKLITQELNTEEFNTKYNSYWNSKGRD